MELAANIVVMLAITALLLLVAFLALGTYCMARIVIDEHKAAKIEKENRG